MLANIALPVYLPSAFWMLVTLLPVVLVEALVLFARLRVSPAVALRASLTINCVSTVAGIPLAVALFGLFGPIADRLVPPSPDPSASWLHDAVFQAPFLMLPRDDSQFTGPTASFTLLVVLFVLTVIIETLMGKRSLPAADSNQRRRAILLANGVSYSCLAVMLALAVYKSHS